MIHGILSVGGLYVLLGIDVLITAAERIISLLH